MTHGSPDYGEYAAFETIGRLVDLGELAVRLGSISHYNRDGNVVFQDNFEDTPLKWIKTLKEARGSIEYSNETAWSGGQCVKLATGNQASDYVNIERYFPLLPVGKYGIEVAFNNVGTDGTVYFEFHYHYNGYYYHGVVAIDFQNDNLLIYSDPDGYVTIKSNLGLAEEDNLFHFIKLVVDTETGYYVRLLIDNTEYNLSAYKMYHLPEETADKIRIFVQLWTAKAASFYGYLDNFIFTQNEV